ncbi:MAG: DNRLRE domain-containing protein, partial [Candidatus Bathyarchaeia archaeon]
TGAILSVYRVTKDWAEMEATWKAYKSGNNWDTEGGDYTTEGGSSSTVPANLKQWMIWDVTAIVKAWIEGGKPNYGFIIKLEQEEKYVHFGFNSKDNEATNLRPILEVDYSPPTPTPRPVGGVLVPANKLAILTPYLALLALIGAITIISVTLRRRVT